MLPELLEATTTIFRKTEEVHQDASGAVHVWSGTSHESEAPPDDEDRRLVDVHFFVVSVDMREAEHRRDELIAILNEWPPDPAYQPENRLAVGPSYIELGAQVGTMMGQQDALRLMALGHALGIWQLITPQTFLPNIGQEEADQLAGRGFVMISGYRPESQPVS